MPRSEFVSRTVARGDACRCPSRSAGCHAGAAAQILLRTLLRRPGPANDRTSQPRPARPATVPARLCAHLKRDSLAASVGSRAECLHLATRIPCCHGGMGVWMGRSGHGTVTASARNFDMASLYYKAGLGQRLNFAEAIGANIAHFYYSYRERTCAGCLEHASILRSGTSTRC